MNDLNAIASFVSMWGSFLKMMVTEHPIFSALVVGFIYVVYRGAVGAYELADLYTKTKHAEKKK